MRRQFKIGILYSSSGPYAAIGKDCRDGATLAIEHCAQIMPDLIDPIFIDPNANIQHYVEGARYLLRDAGCRNVIGTVTSAARKEIIPVVEKHDGLLWYTCPYEGFEANTNVIYTGGCPNQHLVPLFDYLLPIYGKRPFLAGANYVWGWEMNRLARELVIVAGGDVAGERYLPIEETNVDRLIAEIELQKPSFVLNNLLGPSSYALLIAMQALAKRKPEFAPEKCPVVSCDLTECDLNDLDIETGIGQLSAACYFDSVDSLENRDFHKIFGARFGAKRRISSMFACTYIATRMCIEAIHACDTDEPLALRQHLYSKTTQSVVGPLQISAQTHHAALPFLLGRINNNRGFDVISSLPAIRADPYLIGQQLVRRPHLRLVS